MNPDVIIVDGTAGERISRRLVAAEDALGRNVLIVDDGREVADLRAPARLRASLAAALTLALDVPTTTSGPPRAVIADVLTYSRGRVRQRPTTVDNREHRRECDHCALKPARLFIVSRAVPGSTAAHHLALCELHAARAER